MICVEVQAPSALLISASLVLTDVVNYMKMCFRLILTNVKSVLFL